MKLKEIKNYFLHVVKTYFYSNPSEPKGYQMDSSSRNPTEIFRFKPQSV